MRHPVHALLAHHASFGTRPTDKELAELKLSPTDRAKVADAAAKAARLRADGNRRGANELALERSQEIVADLPAEQQDPDYGHTDPLADVSDPKDLAAAVPRMY